MKKIAVVLLNLGGPSSLEQVESFLFNLFYDPSIIRVPNPFRYLIAKIISKRRTPIAKEIYKHIGNKSPILENTVSQAKKLEEMLKAYAKNYNFKVFVSMRYSSPFSYEVVEEIQAWQAEEVLLIPLYPQFSTTTTLSSFKDFDKYNFKIPVKKLCCFYNDKSFIDSHVEIIKPYLSKPNTRILFSAHGLPEKVINSGDPYQWQVEETVKIIAKELKLTDYSICYQSRVGPLKWIGPSTEEEIIRAGQEQINILLVPIAFVSEHSETLVELDIEYKKLAKENGVEEYTRVPTLSLDDNFITSLAYSCLKLVENNENKNLVFSSQVSRLCPKEFCGCINQREKNG
jgi:ferrochelatase